MRKLIIAVFSSLDGVMQAPGGPSEDKDNAFELGGWGVTQWDEMMGATMDETMKDPFDLLLGRRTYDIFAAHWPHSGDAMGALFDRITKYVVTHRPESLEWQNSEGLGPDPFGRLAELRQSEGPNILLQGSSTLIPDLWSRGLVDELVVWSFPVVLGKGKRVFGAGTNPGALTLIDSKVSSTGVVITTYKPAGELPIGSFALDGN
jgi:dihydrofolate reductase